MEYCQTRIPQVKPLRPQASYLVWLDCRALGLRGRQLNDFFVQKVGVALNEGGTFGPGGDGFMRLNVGTQRAVLAEALARLEAAVRNTMP
jgi:cystathionine beta-lyase